MTGVVLVAPHVVVEEMTLAAIRRTREAYATDGLRERMARHHDDPDAAFWGWCDVWLDPGVPATGASRRRPARSTAPLLLVQGADDPYGTLDQIDRIESRVRGPRRSAWSCPAATARTWSSPDAVVARIAEFAAGLP